MNNSSLIHKHHFYVLKAQRSFRVIFAKSRLLFCFLFGVKRFFQKPLYFLFKFLFLKWIKTSPNLSCQAWPTCRRRPTWSNPTRWHRSNRPVAPPRSLLLPPLARSSDCVASLPPRLIPTTSVGVSHRDGCQSIDLAMALLPVREIWSITPLVLSSLSPPALSISAMATSSLVLSCLAFSSARSGAW
jgi:hypothetical protein